MLTGTMLCAMTARAQVAAPATAASDVAIVHALRERDDYRAAVQALDHQLALDKSQRRTVPLQVVRVRAAAGPPNT